MFSVSCRVNCIPISAQTAFPSTSKLQQLTMRSNRGDACFLSRPFLLLANFSFFFFFSSSIFNFPFSFLETIISVTRSCSSILKKFRRSKIAADSIQCLSVQKSSILTRYYVDNVVRNLYIYMY